MISAQTTAQASGLGAFFSQYGLLIVLVVLLVFMLWSSNRRRQKMKLEQEERAREALTEERARIARELHDVVSHGLTVVVVQSQAARRTLEDAPGTPPTA